ncbi:unnamed protein product [Pleuronectes platessa]|uniref:Uncharacterized protein n=1 Tax=Pleuronectes platessa TaxID=8262 RepID=A0A9N7YWU8_PLEPL|nr:unnamed protein product [Pleuronectes platessa]
MARELLVGSGRSSVGSPGPASSVVDRRPITSRSLQAKKSNLVLVQLAPSSTIFPRSSTCIIYRINLHLWAARSRV